jgi:type IV secretory pathway TraG/TraD family ATPase VirD4
MAMANRMNRPEEDQHLWFVVDELDALGAIDGLKDALARLRKFGGRCVIGFQSISQVSNTYGAGDAQTITENCANTLILRCSGSDNGGTSHFASRLIGEREIVRRQTSRGRDHEIFKGGARRSTNVATQHVIEAAVMPSELEQLPDLAGYLKTASSRAWRRVRLARQR